MGDGLEEEIKNMHAAKRKSNEFCHFSKTSQ